MNTAATIQFRLGAACLLLCAASAHAELYKWVDANGKVNYTDTPPPPNISKVEKKSLRGGGGADQALPYELGEAVRNNPVTLYTNDKCPPCDDARRYLKNRGVPFSEKLVVSAEDQERMQLAGGEGQLPFFVVGRNRQTGFEPGGWGSLLTAAGYPESNTLPRGYQFAAAEPAAPKPQTASLSPAQQGDTTRQGQDGRTAREGVQPRRPQQPQEERPTLPGFQF